MKTPEQWSNEWWHDTTRPFGQFVSAIQADAREGMVPASSPKRMYPIQDGPSVPWEVMTPHEAQSQRNHGQSIQRIAERGGFSCSEAWCVVNGIRWMEMEQTIGHQESKKRWIEYAERINSGMVSKEELRPTIALAVKALESALAGVWDGHYSGKGVVAEYAQSVDKEVKSAITRLESLLG